MTLLERYVVLLFDKTSSTSDINEARKIIFTNKAQTLENLPPTRGALQQHVRRASLQARLWSNALSALPIIEDPSQWGWVKTEDGWQPHWSDLPEASKVCREFIRCSCKNGCSGRCSYKKSSLKCTALCHCGGDCFAHTWECKYNVVQFQIGAYN
jgi:hypothetical protein